jgi:YhcH/YjgK/YiaL family protein
MIIDKIENITRYDYVPFANKVADFIKNNDIKTIANGKYDLGDDCYVNVTEYKTKEEDYDLELEAHVNYLDVQLTAIGEEILYYQAIELGESIIDYDKNKDMEFFSAEWTNQVTLYPGNMAIIFPNDLHAGGFTAGGNDKIKKFVFKLKI